MTTTAPPVERLADPVVDVRPDKPWQTVVWDDPVNTMHYVARTFVRLFELPLEEATRLMLQVHEMGRAVVTAGTKDKMEVDVARLHEAGLWATLQQQD